MKSTRKMFALVLALVLCLALFPASASAAGNIMSSGKIPTGNPNAPIEFVLYTDGTLVISGTGPLSDMNQWSFTSGFNGAYTSQNDAVRQTRSEVRTLVIGEGITGINQDAFRECPNMVSVTLPVSLGQIGANAFMDCSSLPYIWIPSNVTSIGQSAFQGCTGLSEVYLSDGLQSIGASAFLDCTAIKQITIPANVGNIGAQAFANCNSLKTVTFTGNFPAISGNTFQNVKAEVYYPVDNDSWNNAVPTAFQDYGGRLTWKASADTTSNNGWVQKNGSWYYYMNGVMVRSNWVAYEGRWFYFGENGRMYTGRQRIDDKYYYFDPATGARQSGMRAGEFYDDNGVWQPGYSGVNDSGLNMFRNGWQQVNGKWFYIKDQAKLKGWLWSNDYWYYLDPVSGAMVTGWLTWNGNTYYLRPLDLAIADGIADREGSMVAGRNETIGGTVYTFADDGRLLGGKMENNPLGLATGFRQEGGSWYFYRSDGNMARDGWELVNNNWYYFDGNGKMKTGWLKWNGDWYYLTPANGGGDPRSTTSGRMVTGFQTINTTRDGVNMPKTYFFKSNGALNGKGWIKVGLKWYYLQDDGVVATGWLRDGNKWYYLRDDTTPIGEMVTGVFDVPSNGGKNNPSGTQSFNSSGEWIGTGAQTYNSSAGSWGKDGNGKWHYYDVNNNALTGWQWIDNKWYYLDPGSTPAGVMLTGWQNIGGQRFYFDGSGAMQKDWLLLDGVWYYLNPKSDGNLGAMWEGWQYINGEWYYLQPGTGACQVGWIENPAGSGIWYYLNTSNEGTYGAMHHGGWFKLNDKWYYLNPAHDGTYGCEIQGWVQDAGDWYYMRESTNPAEGWMVTGRQQLTWNGKTSWYYFNSDGRMQRNVTVDGHTYGPDGAEI